MQKGRNIKQNTWHYLIRLKGQKCSDPKCDISSTYRIKHTSNKRPKTHGVKNPFNIAVFLFVFVLYKGFADCPKHQKRLKALFLPCINVLSRRETPSPMHSAFQKKRLLTFMYLMNIWSKRKEKKKKDVSTKAKHATGNYRVLLFSIHYCNA